MPDLTFDPLKLAFDGNPNINSTSRIHHLQHKDWIPILQQECDFGPDIFEQVSINLIKNPNINSSHLFRADILYDSLDKDGNETEQVRNAEQARLAKMYAPRDELFEGFRIKRTMIRMMVPRNPQLDRPIAQTCYFLQSAPQGGSEENLVVYVPHVLHPEELPWYHPTIRYLAYRHNWQSEKGVHVQKSALDNSDGSVIACGSISIHFCLFPSQSFPLPERLLRTAYHLLSTLFKHGQGTLAGYTKRVHHDQLVSQQRVQNTYAELKRKYAKRLCEDWVEQTEPSKHVFEDLGIAAFLIELWRDMYLPPKDLTFPSSIDSSDSRHPHPGFVDIGCGNGVLVEILLLEGYQGWGFDARRRKTWSILSPVTKLALHEMLLIPSPLFDMETTPSPLSSSLRSRAFHLLRPSSPSSMLQPPLETWHDGLFPFGTFIISNHADELTPWTPLLASLSCSPFLAIPCCSHNLSGVRFRAPTVFNSQTADHHAPTFFAKNITKSKGVPIDIASYIDSEEPDSPRQEQKSPFDSLAAASDPSSRIVNTTSDSRCPLQSLPNSDSKFEAANLAHQPSTGDLKALAPKARAKQPSAYSSLCDWVGYLATEVGYVVEKEMLRIPSTRNVGIVGRFFISGSASETLSTPIRDRSATRTRSSARTRSSVRPSNEDHSVGAPTSCSAHGRTISDISNAGSEPKRSLLSPSGVVRKVRSMTLGSRPSSSDSKRGASPAAFGSDEEEVVDADAAARRARVVAIAKREGADGRAWIQRAVGLGQGKGAQHI
ncbi:tRNA(Ser) Um(44) 2'-O-methyltransferase [Ptychographa xylographoides]|nr:tRNA(Ser) Um(44) 2'-O-methyltransferase [Ptychographa xylographoides]